MPQLCWGSTLAALTLCLHCTAYPPHSTLVWLYALPSPGSAPLTLPAALQEFGFEPHEVQLRIAFGTGKSAWTNHRCGVRSSHRRVFGWTGRLLLNPWLWKQHAG